MCTIHTSHKGQGIFLFFKIIIINHIITFGHVNLSNLFLFKFSILLINCRKKIIIIYRMILNNIFQNLIINISKKINYNIWNLLLLKVIWCWWPIYLNASFPISCIVQINSWSKSKAANPHHLGNDQIKICSK